MSALLALLASGLWGTSDFLGGLATRRLGALSVYGGSQVVSTIFVLVVIVAAGAWRDDPGYWPWAVAASVIGFGAMLMFYEALAIGPMGIVAPIVGLSVLVPLAVGLLTGERPTTAQLVGIASAVVAVILASGPELGDRASRRPLLLAIGALVGVGFAFVAMARGSASSPLMTVAAMRISTTVIVVVLVVASRRLGGVTVRDLPSLATIGAIDAAATIGYTLAASAGLLSVVAVLASLYPVVTALLAAIVLHERLRPIQYLGVAFACVGIALVTLG